MTSRTISKENNRQRAKYQMNESSMSEIRKFENGKQHGLQTEH